MKRWIPVLLTVCLLCTALLTPAAAAETSIHYLDLMEMGYLEHAGAVEDDFQFYAYSSGSFSFPVTAPYALGECSIMIYTNDANLRLFSNEALTLELTKTQSGLGSRYWVFTGDFGGSGIAKLYYQTSMSSPYVHVLLARTQPYQYNNNLMVHYDMSIQTMQRRLSWLDQTSTTFAATLPEDYYAANIYEANYAIQIYPDVNEIRGMDYIDLDFFTVNMSINSISASVGGTLLEVDYSQSIIDSDGVLEDGGAYEVYPNAMTYGMYKLTVRVDISGFDFVSDVPIIFINTQANNLLGDGVAFHVYSMNTGYYFYSPDPEVSYLRKIWNSITDGFAGVGQWIAAQTATINTYLSGYFSQLQSWISSQTQAIVTAIKGDQTAGDGLKEEIAQQEETLQGISDTMDSVTRPPLEDVDISVDSYVSQGDVILATQPLTVFLNNDIILTVLMMSLTMALGGYVLYGKR